MVVKLPASSQIAPRFAQPVHAAQNFGQRIEEVFVITREMTFDRWKDRSHNVVGAAVFRQENFDARTGGFGRFNEDELVLVRNDHRTDGGRSANLEAMR